MDEFRIITPRQNELLIVNALPHELEKQRLPGAVTWTTQGDFGKMFFHHFAGNGFNIWYSNYLIKGPVRLIGKSDNSILEFHTQYSNIFTSKWNEFTQDPAHLKQYQLSFVPDVDTEGIFEGQGRYDTFDIHFQKEFLHPYAAFCPTLEHFLNDVENRNPSRLLRLVRFLTPEMEAVIKSILHYSYHEGLTSRFFEGKVHELLILLVHHTGLLDKLAEPDPAERRKAEQVRKIIVSDFSVYDSVEALARKVNMTEHKLQLTFKQVYGMTVGKYSKDERMKKAHEILMNSNEILLAVALMVGYNDAGNFSVAFKQYFGYSPGHIQKRLKKQ